MRRGWIAALFALLVLAACESPEEKAQSYYEAGEKLFKANEFVKAGLEYRNALKLNKDLVPAWYGLAQVEERKKNWADAVKFLQNTVILDPKHVEAHKRLCGILLAAGRPQDALRFINSALQHAPEDADALAMRAAVFFKLNDKERAKREAEGVLAKTPENTAAIMVLAAGRVEGGDAAGALAYLNKALEKDDKDLGLNLFKLQVLTRLDDKGQVEALLRKLVTAYPAAKSFRRGLANFYISNERKKEAERELRAIAAKFPEDTSAGLDVVRFLNTYEGNAAARAELDSIIVKGGNVFPYQLALVQLLVTNGKNDQAEQLLREIIHKEGEAKNGLIARHRLAQLLQRQKKTEEAEKLIAEVLAIDRRNVAALSLRAAARMDQNRPDEAITDLRTALNEAPKAPQVMLLLARAYELKGAAELAEDQLGTAVKLANYTPSVGLAYVRFLSSRSKFSLAEDVLAEILARNPKNEQVLVQLANLRLRQKNWLGAEQVAETLRTISENEVVAGEILSAALAGQNKFDESIKIIKDVYSEKPAGEVQPMASLYRAYVRAGKFDEADAFLKAKLRENPGNAEAQILTGSLQFARKQPEDAEAIYKDVIKKHPKNLVAYRALVNLYQRQRRFEDGIAVARKGVEQIADADQLRFLLADLHQSAGDLAGAVAEYESLLRNHPGAVIVANNLASIYAEHYDDEKSLNRAQELAKQLSNARLPHFKDTIGWIHYRRGEYREAINFLKVASEGLPNNATVRYHLGMSYKANAQNSEAIKELTTAIKLSGQSPLKQKDEVIKTIEMLKSAANSKSPQ